MIKYYTSPIISYMNFTFKHTPIQMSVSLISLLFLAFITSILAAWTFEDGPDSIIKASDLNSIPLIVQVGDVVVKEREFCFERERQGIVSHNLVEIQNLVANECFNATIRFTVPPLNPGHYVYQTNIRHRVNPIKTITVPTEAITFQVE